MHRLLAFAVLAIPLSPAIAQSQSDVNIVAGTRLRITEREGKQDHHVGTVVAMSADSVVVRLDKSGERSPFAWAGLSQIEVSEGKHGHTVAGVAIGLFAGAGIGATIGALSSHSTTDDLEVIEYGLEGAVLGAVVGMIAGGMIGANHKTEKWSEVELESVSMSVGAGRNGDIALMLSINF